MVVGNTGVTYTYDMNSRLTSEGVASFEYDWVGNRLVPGSAQYNAADQLTSGFGHTYNYDGRGNLTSSVGLEGKTYTYTPANLLSSVTHDEVQGTPTSSMTWDGDSNRVSFTRSTGGTWEYVYDITAGIPAVIEEVKDGVSVYYIREPNGALIARISGSDVHYYHFDALGSTRLLTDGSGALTDEYSYDAWGNVISHDQHVGSIDQPYQFVGQLGYYTHWQDPNLDLLQLGVRFYDSESGRFTQVDPIRDGLSSYQYAGGNPTSFVDPNGLAPSGPLHPIGACTSDDTVAQLLLKAESFKKAIASHRRFPYDDPKAREKHEKEIKDLERGLQKCLRLLKRAQARHPLFVPVPAPKPKPKPVPAYDTCTAAILACPEECAWLLDPGSDYQPPKPIKPPSWWECIMKCFSRDKDK